MDRLRPGHDRPTANWLWLANLPRSEQILTIGEPDPVLAEELARHFAVVCHQVLPRDTGDRWRLPFPDAVFDCVAVSALNCRSRLDHLVDEAHRVLQPGGCARLAVRNSLWYGYPLAGGFGVSRGVRGPRALSRLLRRAGYQKIQTFYLDPSAEAPRFTIPCVRRAVLACEDHIKNVQAGRSAARRFLATVGLHAPLYPGIAALAFR